MIKKKINSLYKKKILLGFPPIRTFEKYTRDLCTRFFCRYRKDVNKMKNLSNYIERIVRDTLKKKSNDYYISILRRGKHSSLSLENKLRNKEK